MITVPEIKQLLTSLKRKDGDIIVTGQKPNGFLYMAKVLDIRQVAKGRFELLMDMTTSKGYMIGYVESGKFNAFNHCRVKDQANGTPSPKKRKTIDKDDVDAVKTYYEQLVREGKI